MSFFKTIEKRRSIRSFSIRPVESSKIKKILKAASMSPSAKGLQSFRIYIVKDRMKKEKLVHAAHKQEYVNAPLLLVFCTQPTKIKKMMGMRGEHLFSIQDATIAASYAQLAATALGLASVWIGNFNEKSVQKIIKTTLRPISILPIGYPNESPQSKKTKKINEIVRSI
ncbi:MAG: nitroreductase family protein [Thermoproteota archaeon]